MTYDAKRKHLFQIEFPFMAKIVCGLPLFATLFCVIWSIIFDFKQATATHCRVPNYLPSVSAAIGSFTPQRYVWRICIALHATPRFMIAVAYYNYHTSVHIGKNNEAYKALAALNSLCHIVEVASLVGLTFVSSTENHDAHEHMFISFMAAGLIYMLLTIYLFSRGRSHNGTLMTHQEMKSLKLKQLFFTLNVSIFLISVYVFFRHNWYCEPGVYTIFASCEYLVIATNIAFHSTAALDFSPYSLAYANTALITAPPHTPSAPRPKAS
ncbi:post-GPI attachment to proteins factor 2 isoform X2 [Aplysia californica]|uniref:Post-GPI attachment to proteins factor 2 isoform X2 n=1 Tax=Aplysia californica TaxID=6500 RepID=A0ABM0JDG5_APLCA|nr:post-GPI attachment to proteins factor 2 isoform X2 [Aplysia californica]